MAAIAGVLAFLVLVGLFFLFRSTGRLGQNPSARERSRHNARGAAHEDPRASGLD